MLAPPKTAAAIGALTYSGVHSPAVQNNTGEIGEQTAMTLSKLPAGAAYLSVNSITTRKHWIYVNNNCKIRLNIRKKNKVTLFDK